MVEVFASVLRGYVLIELNKVREYLKGCFQGCYTSVCNRCQKKVSKQKAKASHRPLYQTFDGHCSCKRESSWGHRLFSPTTKILNGHYSPLLKKPYATRNNADLASNVEQRSYFEHAPSLL